MPLSKELHAKYHSDEPITDEELSLLLSYYTSLRKAFAGWTPPEYSLVERDIERNWLRLTQFTEARKADKPKGTLPDRTMVIVRLYAQHRCDREAFLQAFTHKLGSLDEAHNQWKMMMAGGFILDQQIRQAIAELGSKS